MTSNEHPPLVHLRKTGERTALCGDSTEESMSQEFYVDHVLPNREGCCAFLYQRMCKKCWFLQGVQK